MSCPIQAICFHPTMVIQRFLDDYLLMSVRGTSIIQNDRRALLLYLLRSHFMEKNGILVNELRFEVRDQNQNFYNQRTQLAIKRGYTSRPTLTFPRD